MTSEQFSAIRAAVLKHEEKIRLGDYAEEIRYCLADHGAWGKDSSLSPGAMEWLSNVIAAGTMAGRDFWLAIEAATKGGEHSDDPPAA